MHRTSRPNVPVLSVCSSFIERVEGLRGVETQQHWLLDSQSRLVIKTGRMDHQGVCRASETWLILPIEDCDGVHSGEGWLSSPYVCLVRTRVLN